MIVIIIIGILATLVFPSYVSYLQRADITEAISVLAEYKTAIGTFWSIEDRLPATGDTLNSTPVDLPFGTLVSAADTSTMPNSIQSLQLTNSGNGIVIFAVLNSTGVFSGLSADNATITLGAKPSGNEILFECGNFSTNAAASSDIGFTNIGLLPKGCNYNGVQTWLNS